MRIGAANTHFERETGLPLIFGVGDGVDDLDSCSLPGAVAIEFAELVGVSILPSSAWRCIVDSVQYLH